MKHEEAYGIMEELTKEGPLVLGTLPLGTDIVSVEPMSKLVIKALREKGIVLDGNKTNVGHEDPEFAYATRDRKDLPGYVPFPMGIDKDGYPVIYRDLEFWEYDFMGMLEISFRNNEWVVTLTYTLQLF